MWIKGNPCTLLVVMLTSPITVENDVELAERTIEPHIDPAIPAVGYMGNTILARDMRRHICITLLTETMKLDKSKYPSVTNDKESMVHTYM